MDVKQAVRAAKDYLVDLLAEEGLANLGLEEIEHDDGAGAWQVTLGFSRPWNSVKPNALTRITGEEVIRRSYRTVSVRDSDGQVLSVKRRDTVE